MTADSQTEQYAAAMDEAITAATRAEDERDVAQAEVASLKRKFEPDDGILIDKLLKLTDDHGTSYMRVEVSGAGEEWPNGTPMHRLALKLVPRARTNVPKYEFLPSVEGMRSYEERFSCFGTYETYIRHGTFVHTCLVHFDYSGVSITAVHEPVMQTDGLLTIEELTQPATVTLTAGKRARTGQ